MLKPSMHALNPIPHPYRPFMMFSTEIRDSFVLGHFQQCNNDRIRGDRRRGVGYLCFASQISTDPSNAPTSADAQRSKRAFFADSATCSTFSNCHLQALHITRVAWPSGLRRWFKAPVSSEAWVRIPLWLNTFCHATGCICNRVPSSKT